jgi:uncharacterized membrane protein YqjE
VLDTLRRLGPALLRHAAGYGQLIGAEAGAVVRSLKRRLMLGLAAFFVAWLSVSLAVVWLVAAVWDSPYRMWLIGGLSIALAVTAIVLARVMGRAEDEPFRRVRAEWAADRELLRQVGARLTEDRHA